MLPVIFWSVTIFALVFVFRVGSNQEKLGILCLVVGSILTGLIVTWSGHWAFETSVLILVGDAVIFLLLLKLCFSSRKFWPIWISGFQLATLLTHVANLLMKDAVPQAYAIMQGFWIYPMYLAVLAGAYGNMIVVRRAQNFDHQ